MGTFYTCFGWSRHNDIKAFTKLLRLLLNALCECELFFRPEKRIRSS